MAEYPKVVAIVGPTAAGKSRLALDLAVELGAEIITADSRQVYRYMDIGTAKPTHREQANVRHYMLDLVEPSQAYSAQLFREEGERVLRRMGSAGRSAFVVGGTGFYIRALLGGLTLPSVPPNPELRARLHSEAEQRGAPALHARLAELDPASAQRIHPNNLPRVIRALEVIGELGGPVPQAEQGDVIPTLWIGLRMEPRQLDQVADARVLEQVEAGLIEETRQLLAMGYGPELPAMQGFGYRQMVNYLEGRMSLAEAISDYQLNTRQYIRRQLTWFRREPDVRWVEAGPTAVRAAASLIQGWLA